MDRSTRNLSIITLLVLVIFLVLNNIARRSDLAAWGAAAFFVLLAVFIWYYDRLRRRGIDDSETPEADYIEPLVYDHVGLPSSVEVVAPNPSTVIHAPVRHAPVAASPAPAPAASAAPAPKSPSVTEPIEMQPPPMPPRPRPDVDNPNRGSEEAVEAQASAKMTETPSDVIARDKSEPPAPVPDAEQHPPATAPQTTTIEEKASPPPSAPAPETHPDLAAKAPEGANLPSVPVSADAGQPVPTSLPGTAPEPISSPTDSRENAPMTSSGVPPKTSRGKGKAKPAANAPSTSGQRDDLKIIEGIGPKMEKALQDAGITTFVQLAAATEQEINAAILRAGMRFAPTVPTWAEQASYAARGDMAGLEAFQKTLTGGRRAKK